MNDDNSTLRHLVAIEDHLWHLRMLGGIVVGLTITNSILLLLVLVWV